jgi:hypothetical protein
MKCGVSSPRKPIKSAELKNKKSGRGKAFRVPNILKNRTMKDELCAAKPMAKKSLMNALENLERKASALVDLANFSDQVVEKLHNPRPHPEPTDGCMDKKGCVDEVTPDLIDLFNLVADKIDAATNRIGNNTEQIKSIIE